MLFRSFPPPSRFFATLFFGLALAGILGGCTYKSEIRQGNDKLPEQITELKTGMNKNEVRELLGESRTPRVFASDNWVYYYRQRQGGFIPTVTAIGVELVFEGDTLIEIRPLNVDES